MSFNIVCFDCDSTLSWVEGIDELARRVGLGEEMSRLTEAAMNGEVPLEAVYGQRLSLVKPDQASIDWLADLYIEEIVQGAEAVFETLSEQNKELHIISGGIRQALLPLARYLNLDESHVHAVNVYFDEEGCYRGYDQASPLARTGGKADCCRELSRPQASVVMIGDGKTDIEAKQAGAYVIGFGGVMDRAVVHEQADVFVSGPSLTDVLPYIL